MSRIGGRRRALALVLVLGVAGAAGFAYRAWRGSPEPAHGSRPGDLATFRPESQPVSIPAAAEPPGETRSPPAPALPPRGQWVLEVGEDGALTVLASDVPRLELLAELAHRLDFELIDWLGRHPRVTLAAVEVSLQELLPRLLDETPYTLRHRLDRRSHTRRLTRLEIGEEASRQAFDEEPAEAGAEAGTGKKANPKKVKPEKVKPPRVARKRSEAERRVALAARAERETARRQERLKRLESPDPKKREFAVFSLTASEPEDLQMLRQVLQVEPDPVVRKQAVKQLGFGAPASALPILRETLDDPAVEVVISAVEAIGRFRDASMAAELEPLLRHSDAQVRESVGKTIEILELVEHRR